MDLIRARNHLVASETAAADKHNMANVGVALIAFAHRVAHRHLTVGADWRLAEGLYHAARPPKPLTLKTIT
jgi:uncharacterized protein YlxP (DUF503 family)